MHNTVVLVDTYAKARASLNKAEQDTSGLESDAQMEPVQKRKKKSRVITDIHVYETDDEVETSPPRQLQTTALGRSMRFSINQKVLVEVRS